MDNRQNETPQDGKDNRKRRWLFFLLILLLFLVAITSCIVGYILGQHIKPNGGRIIDTIVLSPADPDDEVPVSLSGIVRYTGGIPCAGMTVELHSEPRVTATDEKGRFFYYDIGQDDHRLYVLDENGGRRATLELTISDTATDAELEQLSGGSYKLSLPGDVLLAEVEIELDSATGRLGIGSDGLCIVQTGGRVTTQTGSAVAEAARFILTPQGNSVLPDGSVNIPGNGVILNNGTYIAPDKTISFPDGIETLPVGIVIKPDAKLSFPNGTQLSLSGSDILLADGTRITDMIVTLPDGTVIDNEKNIITASDGTVIDTNKPGVLPDGTVVREDGAVITPSGTEIYPPDGGGYIVSDDTARPIGADTDGGRVIIRENADGIIWTQKTKINLFDGSEKLCPGASGSYDFSVKNTQSFDIGFTMTISEAEHAAGAIPFVYRIKAVGGYAAGSENGWITAEQLREISVSLPSGGNTLYSLEWRWPFDSGNDGRDTRLSSHDDAVHTINITIKAEQLS